MFGFRQAWIALALGSVLPGAAQSQQKSPQGNWGLQGAAGIGGGDKLGFGGTVSLGPRYRSNLFSIRGTVGTGSKNELDHRDPAWELGLTYGRRFCSPGACYGFAIGPGMISVVPSGDEHPAPQVRTTTGALLWQFSLQGTVSPTTSLGLTFLGNRNSVQNFWGLFLGVQFGMPWHGRSADDSDEE
jgi:hypothetical protein